MVSCRVFGWLEPLLFGTLISDTTNTCFCPGRFARAAEVLKELVLNDLAATQLEVNVSSETGPVITGLSPIVALYYHSSTLYQIH